MKNSLSYISDLISSAARRLWPWTQEIEKPPELLALEEEIGRKIRVISEKVEDQKNRQSLVANCNEAKEIVGISLYDCHLSEIPEALHSFSTLISLNLESNSIQDLSPLKGLSNLQRLYFSKNQVSDLSPLGGLKELKTLDFSKNQVSDLSPLGGLKELRRLFFNSNQVSDLSPLGGLKELLWLSFNSNQVSDLSPLGGLKELHRLYFNSNQVSDLSPLGGLKELKTLDFSSNQVSDLSPLGGLKELKTLDFSSNQVSDLSPLGGLKELLWLYFYENLISDISVLLTLPELHTPSKELLRHGKEAVLNEFKQKNQQGVDLLFEAKALIIGEGGVGKTSFCRRFFNANNELPEEEDSTEGADVHTYNFDIEPKELLELNEKSIPENGYEEKIQESRKYLLHFWDFAGQKRYLPTHVFFFSERSVYILVTDNRYESRDLRYWLHLVGQIAGKSKVILIVNKKDGKPSSLDVEDLKSDFKHLDITAFESDIKANEKRAQMINEVLHHAKTLKHIGETVPAYWVAVRNALTQWSSKTMTKKEFYQLCNKNGIQEEEDIKVLASYFHEIGVFLFYQEKNFDSRLSNIVFLDKNWTLDAVYKVLDAKSVVDENGRFTSKQAQKLWSDDCYSEIKGELLELLQEFGLVYPLGDNEYIVPEHLPQKRPEIERNDYDSQRIQYRFEHFMPRGLISRLTVALYDLIESQDRVWKYGVLLKKNSTCALVTEIYEGDGGIEIKLSGSHKQDMRVTITNALDKILEPFRYLKKQVLIPCNCPVCMENEDPHFFDYHQLLNYLEMGKNQKDCEKMPFHSVDIATLIRDNYGEGQIQGLEGSRGDSGNANFTSRAVNDKNSTDSERLKKLTVQSKVLGTEVETLTIKKQELDKIADSKSKRVLWPFLILSLVVTFGWWWAIENYTWDIAEPYSFLYMLMLVSLGLLLSILFGHQITPKEVRDKCRNKKRIKLYAINSFNIKEYETKVRKLEAINREIDRLCSID